MRGTETFDRAYKAGDKVTMTNTINCAGVITNGQKGINFTIPLPNPVDATGVAFTKLNVIMRSISGYVDGSSQLDLIASSDYTVSASISFGAIYVSCTRSTALNITNNTPIIVDVRSGTSFTFS